MRLSVLASSLFQSLTITVLVVSVINVSLAQVRTSTNYQLQSDSINVGGGYSSSTLYQQESTVGEIATGPADSTSYALRAGYQQMQEVYVSLTTTGNVIMSPDLPGLTGGTSNGSSTFTVITDSPSGYRLTIEAENDPAMQSGGNTIADYDEGVETDYSFITGGSDAHFGYTPEGDDIVQAFKDDGAGTCNVDVQDSSLACWAGLSTTPVVMAEGVGSNHPNGATTTVHFRVGIGSGAGVIAGVYTATTTVTAVPL
ncbi:hypothetical protein KC906_04410 [Candidatus Kaiserbacteria bacterium]|nr:hypothetical protein [Candidatus Kaiserbacteria bacterium]